METQISAETLKGVAETLLPVLYSRVVESRRRDAIFYDAVAIEWVKRLDYDFSPFEKADVNNLGVAVRTEIFDDYCRDYLAEHPQALVVNIAAGLDTRFYRMDNGLLYWIELDLPEAIAIRKQLMKETERHYCLAASALDTTWIESLPNIPDKLFIVEGLLMYFSEAEVKQFISNLAEYFPNAEMLLEVIGVGQAQRTHLNDAISKTDAQFRWGIRDASVMADWHSGLEFLGDTSLYERYEARWLALPLEWKDKPIAFRNSVDRIVHLRVKP